MRIRSTLTSLALISLLASSATAAAPECSDIFGQVESKQEFTTSERIKRAHLMAIPMENEAGRVMFVEAVAPANPELPMLLLMPGMNRAGKLSDPSAIALISAGYGVAEMSFSVHPYSVAMLPKGTEPFFKNRQPTLQDLANEVDRVATVLTEQMSLKNVVPVSLSFSGALSPLLKGYPLIIETVPMTSERAVNTEGAKYRDSLKAGELFNPFFGPSVSRYMMDQAYQTKWIEQAKTMIAQFGLPAARLQDMVDGYSAMSRAAEDASWANVKLPKETKRVFILALGEGPELLMNQVQTLKRLMSDGQNLTIIAIGDAGHIVHVDQPRAFAKAVEFALGNTHGVELGAVNIIMPANAEHGMSISAVDAGKPAMDWLDTIIAYLNERVKK